MYIGSLKDCFEALATSFCVEGIKKEAAVLCEKHFHIQVMALEWRIVEFNRNMG